MAPCRNPGSEPFLFERRFFMTETQFIDAKGPIANSQGPRASGPNVVSSSSKAEKGKKICSLNAYRHGLTSQLNIFTPEEQKAYDNHSKITVESLAPVGAYELDLAQSIADDYWRLKRARTIESSLFAMGMRFGDDDTGSPQVDDAFAQARAWIKDARNLDLLTTYA